MNERIGTHFCDQAVRHLTQDYLPKIRHCLACLTEEEIWWRPNENSNSVGNLLLHLVGNVRQWIVAALGGDEDVRRRDEEFAARGQTSQKDLLKRLEETISEAAGVIEKLDQEMLLERHRIQIFEVTALQSVFHVVEHVSYHTGQVCYITKLLKGRDLGFYPALQDERFQKKPIRGYPA